MKRLSILCIRFSVLFLSKWLFGGMVPPQNMLFSGTVPPQNMLFGGTVPPQNMLFGGTVPPQNVFFVPHEGYHPKE